jgi:hypothetical protein
LEFESPAFEFKNEAEKIVCQVFEEVEDRSKEQRESFRSELAAICKPYRDEISKLGNINEAGILGIYQTRIDAFEVFKDFIKEEERELVIVGSSLLGLLQNADTSYYQIREPIRKKIEDRLYIRFLLTHPMVADLRARQENRSFQDIGKEIIKSLKLLTNEWNVKPENIKLYQGTPTCFGIRTGRAMLLNFYPYGKVAYESTCFIVRKGGYIYRQFSESHFGQWNSNIASELPGNIESLSDDLEGYEESIKNLFSLSHDSR